jgi:hypothetical protein
MLASRAIFRGGWPLLLAAGALATVPVSWLIGFSSAFIFGFVAIPVIASVAIGLGIGAILAAINRSWFLSLSFLLGVAVIGAVLLRWEPYWRWSMDFGEWLNFEINKPSYVAEVGRQARSETPLRREWAYGGFVTSHLVVYDESDEIALPPDKQSENWRAWTKTNELQCGYGYTPVGDHFYLVGTGC